MAATLYLIFFFILIIAALSWLLKVVNDRRLTGKSENAKLSYDLNQLQIQLKDLAVLEEFKISATGRIKADEAENEKLSYELHQLQSRFKDVIDIEDYKTRLSIEIDKSKAQISETQSQNAALSAQAETLRKQLEIYSAERTVVDCGFYARVYDFDISQKYKDATEANRDEQKTILKDGRATVCPQTWTINGDVAAGRRFIKNYSHLMLRAFNGESDSIIGSTRWNNLQRMIDRLESTFQAVNKLGETQKISIQRSYFQLKLGELHLTYEYEEKLNAEREEQRKLRERIREEERAQREFQEQIRKSEEEERRSRIALERAKQELQVAQGAAVASLNTNIQALEGKLAEALANKERAKSRAEMTKAGNVYVISNIGSFGENRFKIGMTRRLDPLERVYELGDASVPFEFDVHAMIPSDNAPQLEAALHSRFRTRSANLVNPRKEFFDVSIEDIEIAVREFGAAIEILKVPEAKTFRQTLALRSQQPQTSAPAKQPNEPDSQVYVSIDGKQEGPYSFAQLNEKIVQGIINPQTALMWYQGLAEWAPIKQFQQN